MSSNPKFRSPHLPLFYICAFPELVRVAREHGYALAVHGSMIRDCDVVAVPWTDEACDAVTLIRALKDAIGGIVHSDDGDHLFPDCSPNPKPHGRVAYSLHFTNRGCEGPYFDVSVMPRLPKAP